MVRPGLHLRLLRFFCVLVAASLLTLLFTSFALPQGLEETELSIQEDYTIELTETGDARVTDVLRYETDYFDEFAEVFDEYPNLLSRRYRGDTDVGEIEDFDVDVNEKKGTVTITFNSPGFAYNMGDTWDIYGFTYEPSKTRDDEMVFEGEGVLNNEFTLFEEVPFTITTTVKFPEGSSSPEYVESESAVKYELPYQPSKTGSFLQDSKTVWVPVFIVLMVLSLLLLLYVIINSRRGGAAEPVQAGPGSIPTSPASPATPPVPPSASQSATPSVPPSTKFCKHCGGALKERDKSFCSNCGKPL